MKRKTEEMLKSRRKAKAGRNAKNGRTFLTIDDNTCIQWKAGKPIRRARNDLLDLSIHPIWNSSKPPKAANLPLTLCILLSSLTFAYILASADV